MGIIPASICKKLSFQGRQGEVSWEPALDLTLRVSAEAIE